MVHTTHKLVHSRNTWGSVKATRLFRMIQGCATNHITGGLRGTAYNITEAHAFIPPVDLLFHKSQLNAITHICALPPKHPLYPIACKVARHFINCHKSPLHYLFHLAQLHPNNLETISPTEKHPSYIPALMTKISSSKETALTLAQRTFHSAHYKVYSDGSCIDNGVGASVILYKNDKIIKYADTI